MYRELKTETTYTKTMIFFSVLTFLFGLATCFVGNIFLPFSTAFCACLFLFENPEKRILSYIVPLVVMVINVSINRLESIIGFEFIILGLLMALLYAKKVSKSESAAYLTFIISFFVIFSLYINGIFACKSFEISRVIAYYDELLNAFRFNLVELLSSTKITDSSGSTEYFMSSEVAEIVFNAGLNLLPSFMIGYSFLLAGISIKLFAFLARNRCKYGILKRYANFVPSSITAYFYILASIVGFLVAGENVFEIAMMNIANILMLPFAYVGIKYLKTMALITGRKTFFCIIIIAGLIMAPAAASRLISYLGVYFAITHNKVSTGKNLEM